jgi:hypothetical protein
MDRKIEHKIRRLREDIMNIKKTIESADSNNKIHFAQRLRLMIIKKEEEIGTLIEKDFK